MDEQRQVRNSLTIVQQSITEFLRYLKKMVENLILKREFDKASEMERRMLRVQETPSKYTIVRVVDGSEQEFVDLLKEENIDHIYINSSFLADYNGSWIISVEDLDKFIQNYGKILNILDTEEKTDKEVGGEEHEVGESGEAAENTNNAENDEKENKEDEKELNESDSLDGIEELEEKPEKKKVEKKSEKTTPAAPINTSNLQPSSPNIYQDASVAATAVASSPIEHGTDSQQYQEQVISDSSSFSEGYTGDHSAESGFTDNQSVETQQNYETYQQADSISGNEQQVEITKNEFPEYFKQDENLNYGVGQQDIPVSEADKSYIEEVQQSYQLEQAFHDSSASSGNDNQGFINPNLHEQKYEAVAQTPDQIPISIEPINVEPYHSDEEIPASITYGKIDHGTETPYEVTPDYSGYKSANKDAPQEEFLGKEPVFEHQNDNASSIVQDNTYSTPEMADGYRSSSSPSTGPDVAVSKEENLSPLDYGVKESSGVHPILQDVTSPKRENYVQPEPETYRDTEYISKPAFSEIEHDGAKSSEQANKFVEDYNPKTNEQSSPLYEQTRPSHENPAIPDSKESPLDVGIKRTEEASGHGFTDNYQSRENNVLSGQNPEPLYSSFEKEQVGYKELSSFPVDSGSRESKDEFLVSQEPASKSQVSSHQPEQESFRGIEHSGSSKYQKNQVAGTQEHSENHNIYDNTFKNTSQTSPEIQQSTPKAQTLPPKGQIDTLDKSIPQQSGMGPVSDPLSGIRIESSTPGSLPRHDTTGGFSVSEDKQHIDNQRLDKAFVPERNGQGNNGPLSDKDFTPIEKAQNGVLNQVPQSVKGGEAKTTAENSAFGKTIQSEKDPVSVFPQDKSKHGSESGKTYLSESSQDKGFEKSSETFKAESAKKIDEVKQSEDRLGTDKLSRGSDIKKTATTSDTDKKSTDDIFAVKGIQPDKNSKDASLFDGMIGNKKGKDRTLPSSGKLDGKEKTDPLIADKLTSPDGFNLPKDGKDGDKKLALKRDDISRVVYTGHHDSFNRAIYQATFGSSFEDNDVNQTTRTVRKMGFIDVVNATNVFAAKNSIQKDVQALTKELSQDQLNMLSKMIAAGNYGKFDLSDPGLYSESMQSLHKFMKANSILEGRSLRGNGEEMFALSADKKAFRGSFVERKLDQYREDIVMRDLKTGQKVKGTSDADKTETLTDKGKTIPKKVANKNAKDAQIHIKESKKVLTNKEKALQKIRMNAKKQGIGTNKDADAIVHVLFKNNAKFANTSRLMGVSNKGIKAITSLNPMNNSLASGSLKDDVNFRYVYRAKSAASGAQALYHACEEIAGVVHTRREAVLSRKLNQMDEEIAKDPLKRNSLDKSRAELEKKLDKAKDKNASIKKKAEDKVKKAEKNAKKKAERVDKLKAPAKKLKEGVTGIAKKIPGFQKVAAVGRKVLHVASSPVRGIMWLISIPGELVSKLTGILLQHVLMPAIILIGQFFLYLGIFCFGMTVILTFTMLIQSFFSTEDGSVDDATATSSTMRIVYDELQAQEATWTKNLLDLTNDITVNVKELKYTDIDENTGDAIPGRENIDAATYIREILGLEYNEAEDYIKTPSPWAGAPEEAWRTVDGTITGGVEVRYIGTGGYPGYTSNIMEIISMATVAQDNSTMTEYEDSQLSEANSDTFIGHVTNFFGSLWKGVSTVAHAVGAIANKIAGVIPGYSEFMQHQAAKSRARTVMAYAKPLFDASHKIAFGLTFSFLPTDRTLTLEGAQNINQFIHNSWYGEGGGNSTLLSEVADTSVAREVWQYLTSHGFDEIHAAGVMGNFYQESRMNPNAIQYPGQRKGGIGLGQWTGLTNANNRRKRLEEYALRLTGSTEGWKDNVKLQMDYMLLLDEPSTVQMYLRSTFADPGAAAYWWGKNWERFNQADGTMSTVRIPAANAYYKMYAEDQSFEFTDSSNNSSGTGNNSNDNETQSYISYKETVKYVHTFNIDDNGNSNGVYDKRMTDTQMVTVPGAESLTIELWYSTERNYDWLLITNKGEGPVTNWKTAANGNIGKKYTGGDSKYKPSDNSNYHVTLTVNGDTAYFNFYTDHSVQKYGYYAKVTGKVKEVDTSWLDDEINASSGYDYIIRDVHTCDGHNGHGCQSYSHFSYDDTTQQYVYYNGDRIDSVFPAGLDPEESGEYPCNTPYASLEEFDIAYSHNPGCWVVETESDSRDSCGSPYTGDEGSSSVFDNLDGVGYKVLLRTPKQFIVAVTTDEDHDHGDDDDDCSYDYTIYTYTHKCQGNHTGYYCGGHMRLLVYGVIYHMTKDERDNNHTAYEDKYLRYENDGSSSPGYRKGYMASTIPSSLIDTSRLDGAKDLFDLDYAIYHVDKSVSDQFMGWTYDNIDTATIPLMTDWNELYGIQTSWTINGINGGSAAGVDATLLSTAETNGIIEAILDQLPHDTTDQVRVNALKTALYYVGKISYSQQFHGAVLREGGKNDCSGFVSRVYYDVIRKILNTDSFVDWARSYGAYRNFNDGKCKPGDILLSGMGNATRKDNHALIYVGKVDGTYKSIDCSNRGGNGNVYYADRGSSYYSNCTYIDMTTAIRGYLTLHPELAGNLFSSDTEEEETPQ